VESSEDVAVVVLVLEMLGVDGADRIPGVSRDSRAFVSSNFVYLPIDGRLMTLATCQAHLEILSNEHLPGAFQSSFQVHL
jgi:hypothetical protein